VRIPAQIAATSQNPTHNQPNSAFRNNPFFDRNRRYLTHFLCFFLW
jgi:hypothetical protein